MGPWMAVHPSTTFDLPVADLRGWIWSLERRRLAVPRAIVLGAGMVGRVIAADLARDPGMTVTVVDVREDALAAAQEHAMRPLGVVRADLADSSAIRELVEDQDVVLGALASGIGFRTLRAVIEAGRPYADISFMAEDAWTLDELARDQGVVAVFDMGVAPGMSNVLAAEAAADLDVCERIDIFVGGLPRERRWPFEYKAAFSPRDVIEEYTRPARTLESGTLVVKEALSESELLDVPGVGTLEAFITDGLRSLVASGLAPSMCEKTLRYPGHRDLMRAFRASGLFSEAPIEVDGRRVTPRDVIEALVFPHWTYDEGEEDLTVMRVRVRGRREGVGTVEITWDLLDHFDPVRNETSMARTTGFPCASVARLLLDERPMRPGVLAPEELVTMPGVVEDLHRDLTERGIHYRRSERPIEG
jgi:lysine 6-dehydrogenase